MRPFDGSATVGWHTPKHNPEARRSVDASIYIRKVQLQPAFSQTPQYLAAMHALSSSMMQFYKVSSYRGTYRPIGAPHSCTQHSEGLPACVDDRLVRHLQ